MSVSSGRKLVFAAALFVASIFVLGVKLLAPAQVQIIIRGKSVAVTQIPGIFTFTDMLVILVASIVLGASATYLLTSTPASPKVAALPEKPVTPLTPKKREELERIAEELKDNEARIYRIILESGGIIIQSELVEKSGLSKATVSRILDALEGRGLIERKRKGMSNVVVLTPQIE